MAEPSAKRPRDNTKEQDERADHSGLGDRDLHYFRQENNCPRTHNDGNAKGGHLKKSQKPKLRGEEHLMEFSRRRWWKFYAWRFGDPNEGSDQNHSGTD